MKGIDRSDRAVMTRTVILMVLLGFVVFVPLVMKLGQIQITDHDKYEELALNQQTSDIIKPATRGAIYDRGMQALAISASVDNVCVNPSKVKTEDIGKLAVGLAGVLGMDANVIAENIEKYKSRQYYAVKRQLEKEDADVVRRYIADNQLEKQVFLEPSTKRYYPYGNFASNVLGFVSSDGSGVEGLERQYDDKLTGTPTRIVKSTTQSAQYEQYYDGTSGLNLVLTLDETIQHFLEKNLSAAVTENMVAKRAFGIVMDVKTGGILGMAIAPSYNPNERNEIDLTDPGLVSVVEDAVNKAKKANTSGEELTEEQLRQAALQAVYRNKAINDTYDPGSTFKIVTASVALEEKVVKMADRFSCTGSIKVKGWNEPIHCHKRIGHGAQSFLEGIQNSCNPVFITVGLRINRQAFWDYMHAFGFFDKTGIDLPSEAGSIIANWAEFDKDITQATYSFGQNFTVTPIQQLTAAAAVANGGKLMWPHIASAFVDDDGNVVERVEPRVVRQVISEETAAEVCAALETVVSVGTGKNAYVKGYRIGGKTGTSQKSSLAQADRYGKYVVSFVGFAPADDPEIAILVAMDEPMKGENVNLRSGGQMAAPLAGRVMADILPYLAVSPKYSVEDKAGIEVLAPRLIDLPLAEAKGMLKESAIAYRVVGDGDTIIDQLPIPEVSMPGNAEMVLYTEQPRPEDPVAVPNVIGKSPEQANKLITDAGLYIRVAGTLDRYSTTIYASMQSAAGGDMVPPGTIITVEFRDTGISD
ncbi:stage V sporulation protein D [Clostridia bacterium]|nr:stage V sporulation protein D [Clostridia bacterium]